MIGKPSQEEINNIPSEKNRKFVESMPNRIPKIFENEFPKATIDGCFSHTTHKILFFICKHWIY